MQPTRIAGVVAGLGLWSATVVLAESPFNANASLKDNLKALLAAKKAATVVLKNGATYQATIGTVGDHFVVLTEPQGKSYFDVLVPIDEIAALEARARDK